MRGKKAKVLRRIAYEQAAKDNVPKETKVGWYRVNGNKSIKLAPCYRKSYLHLKAFYTFIKKQGKHHAITA